MIRPSRAIIAASCILLLCNLSWAQPSSDEPTPPSSSDEPAKPSGGADEPSKPSNDEPAKPSGDPDEPAKRSSPRGPDEPGGSVDEPPPPPTPVIKKQTTPSALWGIGLHMRAMFLHPWFFNAVATQASTPLNAMAFGAEAIRRKGDFDIAFSIDFGLYGPEDGNWLGKGESPERKTDYVVFSNFNMLTFGAHFVWHAEIAKWVSFVYGAGVGVSIVLGDLLRISNDPARCVKENAGNENLCFPKGVDPNAWQGASAASRDRQAKALGSGPDDPDNPHQFKSDAVPPVLPMLHLLVGFDFKLSDVVSLRVDGGFRNAFYLGATGYYFF